MRLSIGTTAVQTVSLKLDTGSDLIWTQCEPCINCYKQKELTFNSSMSSTFQNISCTSLACSDSSGDTNCVDDDACKYSDGSSYKGIMASDTFTFPSAARNSELAFKNIKFGCVHNNGETYNGFGTGVVGLSGGPSSLISQLGMDMSGKFSHCFVPHWSKSTKDGVLYTGENAVMLGRRTFLNNSKGPDGKARYYVNLEGISVGTERVEIPPGTFDRCADGSGGVIMDSGTPFSRINEPAYSLLTRKLGDVITLNPLEGDRSGGRLCYVVDHREDLFDFTMVPIVTLGAGGLLRAVGRLLRRIVEEGGWRKSGDEEKKIRSAGVME